MNFYLNPDEHTAKYIFSIMKAFSFETADSQPDQLSPSNNYKCSQSNKQTNPTLKLVSLAVLKFFSRLHLESLAAAPYSNSASSSLLTTL
jgi:hypothetical protein